MNKPLEKPTEEAVKEARLHPNGWVYVIEGGYKSDERVPPEAIVGAWKVDEYGHIVGDFVPNPNYSPKIRGR